MTSDSEILRLEASGGWEDGRIEGGYWGMGGEGPLRV